MLNDQQRLPLAIGMPGEILAGILNAIRPEKVICFGMRSKVTEAWSCFLPDSERQTATSYDVLILTAPNEKRPRHALLDMVEGLNTKEIQVNALIHNIIAINESVASGSLFFSRVCNEGLLLYDNHNISLNALTSYRHLAEPPFEIERVWAKWFDLARKFLAGASRFFGWGWNDLSAFMLHQAVEHTCIALTRTITGYRPNTHNLKRLITLIDNFAPFSPAVFPRDTKEEICLFHILSRAYSDARYKEVYWVTQREIIILIDRVSAFQGHAEDLYRKRIMKRPVSLNP